MKRTSAAAAALCMVLAAFPFTHAHAAQPSVMGVHASGNKLLNSSGQTVRLFGVSRQGTEYACISGMGVSDGPIDASSFDVVQQWHVNAVRVPLNEDCWLARKSGLDPSVTGSAYWTAIAGEVATIKAHGMIAILDLHLASPNGALAQGQIEMPDRDNSVDFWRSVSSTFANDPGVIFDLYNEPFPAPNGYDNRADAAAWTCWRDGTGCGLSYTPVGMQTLVNTVRATGAKNLLMLGGLSYASRLNQWLTYEPFDPLHNVAPSWHVYDFSDCSNQTCWDSEVAPLAKKVPVIVGEFGQTLCLNTFVQPLLDWMDARSLSYLAWAWYAYPDPLNSDGFPYFAQNFPANPDPCDGPTLISDYVTGTPKGLSALSIRARYLQNN